MGTCCKLLARPWLIGDYLLGNEAGFPLPEFTGHSSQSILEIYVAFNWHLLVSNIWVVLCQLRLQVVFQIILLLQFVALVGKYSYDTVIDGCPCLNLFQPISGSSETLCLIDVAHNDECMLIPVELVQSTSEVMSFGVELKHIWSGAGLLTMIVLISSGVP